MRTMKHLQSARNTGTYITLYICKYYIYLSFLVNIQASWACSKYCILRHLFILFWYVALHQHYNDFCLYKMPYTELHSWLLVLFIFKLFLNFRYILGVGWRSSKMCSLGWKCAQKKPKQFKRNYYKRTIILSQETPWCPYTNWFRFANVFSLLYNYTIMHFYFGCC